MTTHPLCHTRPAPWPFGARPRVLTALCTTLSMTMVVGCSGESDTPVGVGDMGTEPETGSEPGTDPGHDAATARDGGTTSPRECHGEPEVMTTADGVQFVRTPDACFEGLPNWPHEVHYVELDGLRQAYFDEGTADGPVVLLLHGQPSWSYLYRKMIPVLADAGFRVIAMDHLGTGRSDKPTDLGSYSYLGHSDRLLRFMDALALDDITMFVQDWGSVIGLRVAGLNPGRFARIAVGNGALGASPGNPQPLAPVEDPDEVLDLPAPWSDIPAQQVPFYTGCKRMGERFDFQSWIAYALKGASFTAGEALEAATWFDLPAAEEAAYDAPFPSRIYMAGVRVFPSLSKELTGLNVDARAGLNAFTRPFLTIWASNDPIHLGECRAQDSFICEVAGAAGQPHTRLPEASHFLQDDQGAEIARRLVAFIGDDRSVTGNYTADCEP